jgi:hypothetical protein
MSEYVELLEDARDSLHDLIRYIEPGTGWTLHEAYNVIKKALKEEGTTDAPDDPANEERERRMREWHEGTEAWRLLRWPGRERVALEALRDGRLTTGELVTRINAAQDECRVYVSDMRPLLKRMLEAGEVDREPEYRASGTLWRWRYFRRTKLDGPIADLNRALED